MTPEANPSTTIDASPDPDGTTPDNLEVRITATGQELLDALSAVLGAVPESPQGPQSLARHLGIDKVLASRLLKALRSPDPVSVVHRAPGPDPLRRMLKAVARHGVDAQLVRSAHRAVDRFEQLIRDDVGDRGSLDAIISAWVPEARREFELRRKQAAFKALSQLKGVEANASIGTVFLHPSDDPALLDVVWIHGLTGLHRLRPGAPVKFASRRMGDGARDREPLTLDAQSVDDMRGLLLEEFCSSPVPDLEVQRVGEVVHYTLAGEEYGPRSAVDLIFAEVNRRELKRYVPAGSGRKRHVFAEIATPVKCVQFDAFIHRDAARESSPELRIYDTAFEGVADVNDPSRKIDLLDLLESVEPLGMGISRARSGVVPRYAALLERVCQRMGWDGREFLGHRCSIDYPLYGSQIVMLFDAPTEPGQSP